MLKKISQYKEVILYLFFGGLTTFVNIGVFFIFDTVLEVHYLLANAAAWFLSVLFAYITNRKWVFESKDTDILGEFMKFVSCRIFSGACDMAIMFLGVDIIHIPSFITKLLTNIVVVVLNYIFSKCFIFNNRKNSDKGESDK